MECPDTKTRLAQFAFNRAETKNVLEEKINIRISHENLRKSAFCRTIKKESAERKKVIFDFHHDRLWLWKLENV